ncbi:MAG: hypothetical protein ACLS69_01440 [Butyricicoccus sp.]
MSDISSKTAPRSRFSVREICIPTVRGFIAIRQISIPMPGGVPDHADVCDYAGGCRTRCKRARFRVIYLLLGAVSVPVLELFRRFDKFIGPPAVFDLLPMMAFIIGCVDYRHAFTARYSH